MNASHSLLLSIALLASSCASGGPVQDALPSDAHLYAGFGNFQRTMTTESEAAQEWFDQGMQLLYGFNHDEAIRSFQGAAALDPDAAMPWWGISFAHGININDPAMGEERSRLAREAADEALARLDTESEVEAALVRAVSERYAYPPPEERRSLDEAYADAMQAVHEAFPADSDVGVLFADALMNLQAWDYWTPGGAPKGRIEEVLDALEGVLRRDPEHPGANHLYIHAVEASEDPDRAELAADRLTSLVPGSGHLVHMPSHIYVRIGRYSAAVDANARAVDADRAYFERAPEPALYAMYYAHNLHFLAYAGMMAGRYEDALWAARAMESDIKEEHLRAFGARIDGIMPTALHVMVRFGKWQEILAQPDYPEYRYVSRAVRRYARAIAYSALGQLEAARVEQDAFEAAVEQIPSDWNIYNNNVGAVLPIARAMLRGELLYREGQFEDAFAALREGIEVEDGLVYDEPPGWMIPVRHSLGALLMAQGEYAKAETIYREDLRKNRNNGWGLLGLRQALLAQGYAGSAAQLDERLEAAWVGADVSPKSSCYCAPGE